MSGRGITACGTTACGRMQESTRTAGGRPTEGWAGLLSALLVTLPFALLALLAIGMGLSASVGTARAGLPAGKGLGPISSFTGQRQDKQGNQQAGAPQQGTPTPTPTPCTWQIVPGPNAGNSDNYLYGVAVASSSDVWAVGTYYDTTLNAQRTLTLHWNGTSWSQVSSPNVGNSDNYLYGVAVASSSDVWAVGYYEDASLSAYRTLVMRWNGTSWSVVSSPNVGNSDNRLYGVAVASSSDVWAVGTYNDASLGAYRTLVMRWNGTSWSVVSSPNVGNSDNRLYGVAVASSSDVWAVGYYYDTTLNAQRTLTLHWNGTSWSQVPSPNVGTDYNDLYGVAVASSNDVWAVGSYYDTSLFADRTLIERYYCPQATPTATNTSTPTATATPTSTATRTSTPSGPSPTATCPAASFRILIVHADTPDPNTLRTNLLAEPGVTQVDLFNAQNGTPTLGQLQQYNIVVVFSNFPFQDPVTLGNNLADYQDGGGVVVASFGAFYNSGNYSIQGRWQTGGYSPYDYTTSILFNSVSLGTYNSGHPLMQGVTTLNAQARLNPTLAAGATQVAAYSDNSSAVAFKTTSGHTAVGLPAYFGDGGNSGTGQYARVIVNAGRWLAGGGCPSPTPAVTNTPTRTSTSTPTRTNTPVSGSPTPTQCPGGTATPIVINGSITTTDPTQTGRLFRDGVPDTCQAAGTCQVFDTTPRHYDNYTFTNTSSNTVCVTVDVNTACTGTNFIFVAGYVGSFDPNNICTNWVADIGSSPNPTGTFSFNVPAGQTLIVNVHEVTANAGCPAYTLTITGLPGGGGQCPSPTPAVTNTPTRTSTPVPPSPTRTAVPPSPTNTSVAPSPTNTAVGPSPTNTSVPPTATNTAVPPTATNTPSAPSPTPTELVCEMNFSDVPPNYVFYPYIRCLYCRGIIGGYSDGTFRPGNPTTRGQMAKIVANAAGILDPIPPSQQTYTDVPPSHPFWVYIERLSAHGIVGGYSDGTFRPDNWVTRGQLTKFASNAAGFSEPIPSNQQTYTDVPPSQTFWLYIERLSGRGIISGYQCGVPPAGPCDPQNRPYFLPDATITRGQTSKIVSNTFFPVNCAPRGR